MKVSHPIARKLLARLESSAGAVVSVKDLTELGSRTAVDRALSRLVREWRILLVRRGLYAWPRTSAWDNLKKALKGEYEESVWDHLSGTMSAPLETGEHKQIAIKGIDDRGNELLVVKKLA